MTDTPNPTAVANTLATQCPKCCGTGSIIYLGAPAIVCIDCGGSGLAKQGRLQASLAELDAKVAAEKEATGEVSLETALAWWNTATAIRDMRSAGCAAMPGLDEEAA